MDRTHVGHNTCALVLESWLGQRGNTFTEHLESSMLGLLWWNYTYYTVISKFSEFTVYAKRRRACLVTGGLSLGVISGCWHPGGGSSSGWVFSYSGQSLVNIYIWSRQRLFHSTEPRLEEWFAKFIGHRPWSWSIMYIHSGLSLHITHWLRNRCQSFCTALFQ